MEHSLEVLVRQEQVEHLVQELVEQVVRLVQVVQVVQVV